MTTTAAEIEVKERPIIFGGPMVRAILEGRKTQTRRAVAQPQRISDEWKRADTASIRCMGKPWEDERYLYAEFFKFNGDGSSFGNVVGTVTCPYGQPKDRLWVRETWATEFNQRFHDEHGLSAPDFVVDADTREPAVLYAADREFPMMIDDEFMAEHDHVAWKSPIHMRRTAARITLEITDIRVQRIQEISEADAIAEGVESQIGDGGGAGPGFKWKGVGYHGAGFTKDGAKTYHFPDRDGACACNVHGPTPAQCAYREAWNSINAKRCYPWESNPWVWAITFKKL